MSTAGYWRTGLHHATPRAAGGGRIAYSGSTKRENGPMDFVRSRGRCKKVMKEKKDVPEVFKGWILGVRNPQPVTRRPQSPIWRSEVRESLALSLSACSPILFYRGNGGECECG